MTLADAGYFSEEHVAELQRRDQQVSMPDRAGPKGLRWTPKFGQVAKRESRF